MLNLILLCSATSLSQFVDSHLTKKASKVIPVFILAFRNINVMGHIIMHPFRSFSYISPSSFESNL